MFPSAPVTKVYPAPDGRQLPLHHARIGLFAKYLRVRAMKSKPITSVQDLIRELTAQRTPSAYADVLGRIRLDDADLQQYCRWNTRHYTRTCLHRDADFELLLVCYEPGQCTSVHDYDSQMAWIHPVKGEIVEERFKLLPDGVLRCVEEIHLFPGEKDRVATGSEIHRFTNRSAERAVSLNLYAKPMSRWRVYDERTGFSRMTPAGPPR